MNPTDPNNQPPADGASSEVPAPQPVIFDQTPATAQEVLPRQKQGWQDILSIVTVLASALVLAFALISFVFQSYQVDGPSMQNTLHNDDHLIVWKVPRTWARVTGHPYYPNRGDIIVFNQPGLGVYGDGADKQLIKRVIGLPGDRVVVNNGLVTVYNKQHPKGFDPDRTLPYGKAIGYTNYNVDITVRPGQLFVCGDNRTDSLDSRVFGPINVNNVVGKLVVRVLPLNDAKVF